jgi:hypothetical protein
MSNTPTPPNNPNPFEQLPDLVIRSLTNPVIFQYASRHPIIGNLLTAFLLSLSGLSVFQFINPQNAPNTNSNFLTRVCEGYTTKVNLGINELIVGSTSWKTNEKSETNEEPSFTCNYKIKGGDNIISSTPRELLIIPRISSKEEEVINSTQICNLFNDKIKERLELEKEGNESIGNISAVKDEENKDKQQLPFNCNYEIKKDNKLSNSKSISVEMNPLFTDFITESYDEEKINMKGVCKDDKIRSQMEQEAVTKRTYDKAAKDEIVPGKPILLDTRKDVYPVFRWVCSYSIKRLQENRSKYGRTTEEYTIGLNLEEYCESKARKEQTERTKPTHHNYNDPYSLYCANPTSSN